VLEHLPVAAGLVDLHGTLHWANASLRTLIGWHDTSMAITFSDLLVHPDLVGWANELFHRVARREPVEQPVHASFQPLDGPHFDGFLRLSALATTAEVPTVLVTITPVTGPRHDLHPLRRALDMQEELVCEFAPRGTILSVNRAYRAFFDCERNPIGRRLDEILDEQLGVAGSGAEMRSRIIDEIELRAGARTEPERYASGRVVEWTNTAVRSGDGELISILAVGRDITDRVAAEDALRRNEERFRTMATHMWETILLLDADGEVIDSTAPYRSDLDHDAEFWTGVELADVLHPDDRDRAFATLAHLVEEGSQASASLEVRARRKGGDHTWLELNATNLIDQPSIGAILVTVRNIEERKQFEHELAEKAERERHALTQRQSFVNQVSHELRNLVHGTLGLSEILNRSELPEQSAEVVHALHRQATTLRRIVDDLIDEAHIEAGRLRVRHESIDLHELVGDLMLVAAPHAPADVTLFAPAIAADLRHVVGDGDRLRQAIHNLLSNALRHTDRGSISIEVTPGSSQGVVRIGVRDTGTGIDPDDVERLFRPYERGARERSHGVGLGLAIVKATVESMGGTVGADARTEGATFWLELAKSRPTDTAATRGTVRAFSNAPLVERLRVLVVDDDPVNLLVATMQLDELHAIVTTARGITDALPLVREQTFDVVFCDLNLQDGTAIDFLRVVRTLRGPQPFVVVMSGAADADRPGALLREGADHFLPKPATLRDLADVLAVHAGSAR
jgi:PAS domain S-box-containing protein